VVVALIGSALWSIRVVVEAVTWASGLKVTPPPLLVLFFAVHAHGEALYGRARSDGCRCPSHPIAVSLTDFTYFLLDAVRGEKKYRQCSAGNDVAAVIISLTKFLLSRMAHCAPGLAFAWRLRGYTRRALVLSRKSETAFFEARLRLIPVCLRLEMLWR